MKKWVRIHHTFLRVGAVPNNDNYTKTCRPTIDLSIETWKAHPFLDGIYQVSTWGGVRSLTRTVPCSRGVGFQTIKGRILKQTSTLKGYKNVSPSIRGRATPQCVHRLVLETWVGPCPDGMQCRHLDGNPSNNRLDNLQWGTPKEDADDKRRLGTIVKGAGIAWSKIKNPDTDVPEMHRLYNNGYTLKEIATQYNLSPLSVYRILKGISYKTSQPASINKAVMRKARPRVEKSRTTKLTKKDIPLIKTAYTSGESIASIARQYGVMWSTIDSICTGRTWKDA